MLNPRHADNFSDKDKEEALKYLMSIKEKRSGLIEGYGCADNGQQNTTTSKENKRASTVTIESFFLISKINAHKRRDVT